MSEEKLPSEFSVFLFSNGSENIYPDNKLNSFTQQLADPLRFDLNSEYFVGLSELFVDNVHRRKDRVLTKDSIFFYPISLSYAENIWKEKVNSLNFFITYCLSQTDFTVYNDEYFSDFLNPYFEYRCAHLLNEQEWFIKSDNIRQPYVPENLRGEVHFDIDFGLNEKHPLYKYKNDKIDGQGKFSDIVQKKLTLKFKKAIPYTLKEILTDIIDKIILALSPYLLNIHIKYTLDDILNDTDDRQIVWTDFENVKDFGENVKEYRDKVHEMIVYFINYFVSTVKKYQKDCGYTQEASLAKEIKVSYLFLYADVVSESIINNTKGRILAIVPVSHIENNYINVKNISFLPVICSEFRSISCVLATDLGTPFPLEASFVPTFVALRFKKIPST